MARIISSLVQAVGRGSFIFAKRVADAIRASGTARCAMVCQLPWGPVGVLTPFGGAATFRNMFAPAGFPRTSDGYLTATKFPWLDLQIVRVLGAGAAAATKDFQTAGVVTCLGVTGLYKGTAGNSISGTVAAATNGVANSFNLTLSITDAFGGNTTETYENLDSTQAAGTYWTAITANSKLVGPLVKLGTGRPANATASLAAGTDGTLAIASADYLGTPGNADLGVALLESLQGTDAPAFVFTDDPGSGLLVAVNAGLKAHRVLMADKRICIIQGLPAETAATAKTNSALNILDHCAYVWGHANGPDDQGTTQNIPLTGPLACIAQAMQPHLSPAYKSADYTALLGWITSLDVSTAGDTVKADLETNNVIAFEKNANGTFSPYNGTMTDGSAMYVVRARDFSAFTMTGALDQFRNGPNDSETIESERAVIESLLKQWKKNRQIDHILRFSIIDWQLLPTEATNTQADLDAGTCTQQYKMKVASEQKQFFLIAEVGTTVTITPSSS